MIQAIVFDFGQTLVDSADGFRTAEKEMQRQAFAALGPAAGEDFLEIYREIRARFHARSDFSRKRILEAVFRHYGREADAALLERWENEYWERVKEMTRVFPEAEAVLTALRGRYRLALITNTQGQKQDEKHRLVNYPELEQFFEVIIVAGESGIPAKPDQAPFRLCLEKLGIDPHEAVFVGDDWRIDICGSEAVGMHPVWLQHRMVREALARGRNPGAGHRRIGAAVKYREPDTTIEESKKGEMTLMDWIAEAVKAGKTALNEYEAKRFLEGFGIPVCRESLVPDGEKAVRAAGDLGYPVVLKAAGEHLQHKTELGAVALNLKSEGEVREEARRLLAIAGCEGLLVQEMVKGDRELVCGLTRDAQFGPCVMFGLGGIFTELIDDAVFRVAPLTTTEALEMMEDIRTVKILQRLSRPAGRRPGRPGPDHRGRGGDRLSL